MRAAIFLLLTLVFCLATACRPAAAPVLVSNRPISINEVPQTNIPLPPTKPLTEMSWILAGGGEQQLKDLAGKVVILDFWATNCPPCRAEIPHLNSLLAKHGADNLAIVGLNVGGDEDRPLIPGFIKETKLDYPIAFPEDELTRFIFSERDDIPQTLILDRNGKIVKKIIGYNLLIGRELDAAVEQTLGRPVS